MTSRSNGWSLPRGALVVALVAILAVGCGNDPVTPKPPAGTVTVFAHEGDRAVPGVHVEVLNTTLTGDTDADGKVAFILDAGTYIVRVFTGNLFQQPYLDNQVSVADHDQLVVDMDLCWSCR